jgi:SAM-dependent methyltransferase
MKDKSLQLNLGCGGRCFADHMNVDIFDECPVAGMRYTKADISKRLPFEDGTADVVFSCHVIEHLWPWDAPEILADWIRVLKPGGEFIVECPNLLGAAAIITAAERDNNADLWKLAMFALYGDPKYKNIEQRHKWGYTPKTLISFLTGMGLKDVRQEPAQFKMREPRDMRVVGVKP